MWQPIETAPKDQKVLVITCSGVMFIAEVFLYGKAKGRTGYDFGNVSASIWFPYCKGREEYDTPTHWMPLPEPPKGEGL